MPFFISGSQSTISYPNRNKSARARDKNVSVYSSMVHFKFDIDFRGKVRAQLFDREFRFENTAFATLVFLLVIEILFSCRDNHPGSYDFNLKFEERSEYPKNHPHCYSRAKDTLIVKDHVAIPFTFTSGWNMKELRMRIRAVFSSKDNFSTPVLPCNNHAGSSQGKV